MKRLLQDSHTEIIMLSAFVIFELRFYYKTINVKMMKIFAEK